MELVDNMQPRVSLLNKSIFSSSLTMILDGTLLSDNYHLIDKEDLTFFQMESSPNSIINNDDKTFLMMNQWRMRSIFKLFFQ
ncbi:hypothetical protein, partial [Klebsiella pneumoniae]|uniref:hypothetical protein n=1 Tax=Klebsiella pneumoniae TaxID=573 RepID=UPI0024DE9C69